MSIHVWQIEIKKKVVYLNGKILDEPYKRHTREEEVLRGDTIGPFEIPKRNYFVLGDNRDESNDSSIWKDPETKDPDPFLARYRIRGILRGFY